MMVLGSSKDRGYSTLFMAGLFDRKSMQITHDRRNYYDAKSSGSQAIYLGINKIER